MDFSTGQQTPVESSDPTAAFQAYGAQLAKYPYLGLGFDLPDQIPSDLLLPFGDFASKYGLGPAMVTIARANQGVGDFINALTIYMMKYFNMGVLNGLTNGFLTTANHDNSALYEAAQTELGSDVFLSSEVVEIDRDGDEGIKIVIQTPSGQKPLQVQKLVVAIPPLLDNMKGFDLDDEEHEIFSRFNHAYYYTTLVDNTNIPNDLSIISAGANTPFNVPIVPGINSLGQTGIPGLLNIFYTSTTYLSDEEIKQAIIEAILRLRNGGLNSTMPNFVAFANHSPFELVVSADEISTGFYGRLNALQGHRNTFYTGAAFSAHDSSVIWALLRRCFLRSLVELETL